MDSCCSVSVLQLLCSCGRKFNKNRFGSCRGCFRKKSSLQRCLNTIFKSRFRKNKFDFSEIKQLLMRILLLTPEEKELLTRFSLLIPGKDLSADLSICSSSEVLSFQKKVVFFGEDGENIIKVFLDRFIEKTDAEIETIVLGLHRIRQMDRKADRKVLKVRKASAKILQDIASSPQACFDNIRVQYERILLLFGFVYSFEIPGGLDHPKLTKLTDKISEETRKLDGIKTQIVDGMAEVVKTFGLPGCSNVILGNQSCKCKLSIFGPFCDNHKKIRCCEELRQLIELFKDCQRNLRSFEIYLEKTVIECQIERGGKTLTTEFMELDLSMMSNSIYFEVVALGGGELTKGYDPSACESSLIFCRIEYGPEYLGEFVSSAGNIRKYGEQKFRKIDPWTSGRLYKDEQNLWFESNEKKVLLVENFFHGNTEIRLSITLKNATVRILSKDEGEDEV